MDTIQITKNMLANKHTKKSFLGCYPADLLPLKFKRPALIIANTDDSSKKGQHWVAFYVPVKGKTEFFDSIGKKPENEYFIKFLKKQGNSYVYNSQRLQGFSSTCGIYCMVYLLSRNNNVSKASFLKLFGSNLNENDLKIEKIYKKNFIKKQVGSNSVCIQTCQPVS